MAPVLVVLDAVLILFVQMPVDDLYAALLLFLQIPVQNRVDERMQ